MRSFSKLLLLVAACQASAWAGTPAADEHLFAGAEHFRADRFPEALVEFKVASRLGATDAHWYVAATLYKLKRDDEALEGFAQAGLLAPESGDELLRHYHALTCVRSQLYLCAQGLLPVEGQSGPKLAAEAARLREQILPLLSGVPKAGTIDWYQQHGEAALARGRPVLARAYLEEALGLATRRPDGHGQARAQTALEKCRPPAPGGPPP